VQLQGNVNSIDVSPLPFEAWAGQNGPGAVESIPLRARCTPEESGRNSESQDWEIPCYE